MITIPFNADEKIETIYIGGGTPSLLSFGELKLLLNSIYKKFSVANDAEITLEANPDDITKTILNEWLKLGINRLSVGLQSFNDVELKWMNRAHNAAASLQCIDDIKAAGMHNFSVDLIFGSPLQSNEDLKQNFDIIANKNVPHISCYALTVEPKTVLNKLINENKSEPMDTDKQAEQFLLLLDMMEKNRYDQYEISSFCKPGFRSRHNSSYWQGKAYYGFGPAAHSFDGIKKRKWNVASNSLYITALQQNNIPAEEEILTKEQQVNEYIMTALRTCEGIDIEKIENYFGLDNKRKILKKANKFILEKKLIYSNSTLCLTREGKFLADGIAASLFM